MLIVVFTLMQLNVFINPKSQFLECAHVMNVSILNFIRNCRLAQCYSIKLKHHSLALFYVTSN